MCAIKILRHEARRARLGSAQFVSAGGFSLFLSLSSLSSLSWSRYALFNSFSRFVFRATIQPRLFGTCAELASTIYPLKISSLISSLLHRLAHTHAHSFPAEFRTLTQRGNTSMRDVNDTRPRTTMLFIFPRNKSGSLFDSLFSSRTDSDRWVSNARARVILKIIWNTDASVDRCAGNEKASDQRR